MNKCEIFFSTNDDRAEDEAPDKGWRGDIIVKIGEELFNPTTMTPDRLLVEFNRSFAKKKVYDIDNNLILVEQADRNTIIKTLVELTKGGYFSKVKPIDLKQEYASCFQELQDLKNWTKVY